MPYYNTYIPQGNNFNNQFMGPGIQQPMPQQMQMPRMEQYPQQTSNNYNQAINLQGKSVDSIDVVKAMDIPLDGSISYFPLTDGSAIITKQLQMDGTSKTIIYKPMQEKEPVKEVNEKYLTINDFEEKIKQFNTNDFKDEIKTIKKQIKELFKEIEEINEERIDKT